MRKSFYKILQVMARLVVQRYRPTIIAITGSIGKTSAKEAIGAVLSGTGRVRWSAKNYNNELGVPLTVFGVTSPGRSIAGWLGVLLYALTLLVFRSRRYPDTLILELGVDHPGDMDHLLSMVRPTIGVLTFVGTVHVEHFGTREALRAEKAKLLAALPEDGVAVVNGDNPECRRSARDTGARALFYGLEERATVRAQEIRYSFDRERGILQGVSFKLTHGGGFTPVLLPSSLGQGAVYAALAAASVGIALGKNLVELSESLKRFVSPPGRLKVIPGILDSTIIDDTYNAEPDSTRAALEVLRELSVSGRKIAVLGDMLELGSYSDTAHRDIGKRAAACSLEQLVIVGERAQDIGRGAVVAGLGEDAVVWFPDSTEAGAYLRERVRAGDLVLVKGSQGMRMEKAVKAVMAEPEKAGELLVRQDEKWLK